MARTIIDIPDPQLGDVDRLCRLLNISRAEAVRRALRDFVQQNDSVTSDGFGLWKDGLLEVAAWRERLKQGRGRGGS
jgi:metal-responsive CopG/Arc/MetJ family transcriptional regulator